MTYPASIKQADIKRAAKVAREEHVMCEIISGDMTLRIYPEFTIPSPEIRKEEEDFIL